MADRKESLEASRHGTSERIKARPTSAEAKVRAAEETVHGQAAQARTQWQPFKADRSAMMQELRGRINANAKSMM